MQHHKGENMVETLEKQRTLTNFDFCDRCSARAYVSASGIGGVLMFCNHHFSFHENKLSDWAFEIIDEREFINN
jgi:hypothetical protein